MSMIQENYLKTILAFELEGRQATVRALAQIFAVKPSSVTEMVKRLSAMNLLIHQNYKGFKLSARGRIAAARVLRRHRLWETFLYEIFKLPLAEVHAEAEKFEHLTSPEMEERLDEFLSRPQFDPHGHPIPPASGLLKQMMLPSDLVPLSSVRHCRQAIVVEVSDSNPALLGYLDKIGLHVQTALTVLSISEFDQSREIEYDDKHTFISRQVAESVRVKVMK